MFQRWIPALLATATATAGAALAQDVVASIPPEPELRSAGPMAFGPGGVLFVADPESAAIVAFETGDTEPLKERKLDVEALDEILAFLLGTTVDQIQIHDLAVNPASGRAYLSVTRGGGANSHPVIVRVSGAEEIEVLDYAKLESQRAELSNAPAAGGTGRRNRRAQSITDIEFHDGLLYVAGLSNEEFASKLRSLEYPFKEVGAGRSVEVYHAQHGAWETRSPVRSFVPMNIGGSPHLLAGYTCTPLVKFPIDEIVPGDKLIGTTVAELGNRNTPLDMLVYYRGEKAFVLIANTSRGVMKVDTAGIDTLELPEERVGGTAGLTYETVEGLDRVTQLSGLDGKRALILVQPEGGGAELRTIDLP